MSSENVARTKEELFHLFVDPVAGVEPYDSFFNSVGKRRMSEDRSVRQAASREWFAFMRIHVTDFLTRFPEMRDDLVEFLEHLLSRRKLSATTRADAEALLAAAKNA